MAKVHGIFKISGSIGDFTFYVKNGKQFVKLKTGASRDSIIHDPNYEGTRKQLAEFAHGAQGGKLLRSIMEPLKTGTWDGRVVARMNRLFKEVKNQDTQSLKGQRSVAIGLQTDAGKKAIKDFRFLGGMSLPDLIHVDIKTEKETGKVVIENLNPKRQIRYPEGATHVTIQSGWARVDFNGGTWETKYSAPITLPITDEMHTLTFEPDALQEGVGTRLITLGVQFYQEWNGKLSLCGGGQAEGLGVVEIGSRFSDNGLLSREEGRQSTVRGQLSRGEMSIGRIDCKQSHEDFRKGIDNTSLSHYNATSVDEKPSDHGLNNPWVKSSGV